MDIIDYVTKKVTPITEELSLRFFKAEYVREDNTNIIRVLVDKKGGLEIDDCIAVSERFSAILEEEDPIAEDYCLEVTSPGAEREISFDEPLEDYIGRYIQIDTYDQKYVGTLTDIRETDLILTTVTKGRTKVNTISSLDVTFMKLRVKI